MQSLIFSILHANYKCKSYNKPSCLNVLHIATGQIFQNFNFTWTSFSQYVFLLANIIHNIINSFDCFTWSVLFGKTKKLDKIDYDQTLCCDIFIMISI